MKELAFFWNMTAGFAGMLTGMAVVTAVWLLTPIAWPWYAVIGSMTTLVVGSIVAAIEMQNGKGKMQNAETTN